MGDKYLNENTAEIIKRYEQFLSGEDSGYFDIDEFETIAEYYLRKGHTKDSNHALDVAMRLHPLSEELQLKRAKIFLANDEVNKALQILDTYSSPDEYEAQLLKIDGYARLNRMKEVQVLIEHIIEQTKDDLDLVCLDIAFIFLSQSKLDIAIDYLEKGRQFNPQNIDLLFEIAYCHERSDKTTEAIQTYIEITNINPYTTEAWFNLGQIYFEKEMYNKSLEAYEFCIAIDETDAFSWLQKAHLHFQMSHFQESIDASLKHTELAGEKMEINFFIAEAYEQLEKYNEAIAYYKKTIELAPTFIDPYIDAGVCALELENYAESLLLFENALKLDPMRHDTYVCIAEAYCYMNKVVEGEAAYLKSLEIEPRQASTWIAMANLQMDMDKAEVALDSYKKAYELDPNLEYIDLLLAAAYAKNMEYDKMFHFLDKVAEKGQKEMEFFFEMCPEVAEILSNLIENKES